MFSILCEWLFTMETSVYIVEYYFANALVARISQTHACVYATLYILTSVLTHFAMNASKFIVHLIVPIRFSLLALFSPCIYTDEMHGKR